MTIPWWLKRIAILPWILGFSAITMQALADDIGGIAKEPEQATTSYSLPEDPPMFRASHDSERPRDFTLTPIVSLFFPGFDQWYEDQNTSAGIYTGGALAGYIYAGYNASRVKESNETDEYKSLSEAEKSNLAQHGEYERKAAFGGQLTFAMGSFSAYHAFRTAVNTHRPSGGFRFLGSAETPGDILMSPLKFEYITRPSSYIPLGIITGIYFLSMNSDFEEQDLVKKGLSRSDVFFTSAVSLAAGTHEEALFRGWLMPTLMEHWGSETWSNIAQATIFASAHLNTVRVPIVQALLGWHLGKVAQNNNWALSESVFIHTWWDVVALLAAYQVKQKDPNATIPPIWLPPLELRF